MPIHASENSIALDVPRGTSAETPHTNNQDPIGTLASLEDRLNNLAAELDADQKLAELGLLTAAVAHEINNALTPVIAYSQLAAQQPTNLKTLQNALKRTLEGAIKASAVSQTILDLAKDQHQLPNKYRSTSRPLAQTEVHDQKNTKRYTNNIIDDPNSHTCDIHAAAQRVKHTLLPIGGHAISISPPPPNLKHAIIPTHWLEHALQNLLLNALRATQNQTAINTVFIDFFTPPSPPSPPIPPSHPTPTSTHNTTHNTIAHATTQRTPPQQQPLPQPHPNPLVGIRIRDIGPGFPDNHFQPITTTTHPDHPSTTTPTHHSTTHPQPQPQPRLITRTGGLGLQITATLIQRAGGQLNITSPPNNPTCIEITLPTFH